MFSLPGDFFWWFVLPPGYSSWIQQFPITSPEWCWVDGKRLFESGWSQFFQSTSTFTDQRVLTETSYGVGTKQKSSGFFEIYLILLVYKYNYVFLFIYSGCFSCWKFICKWSHSSGSSCSAFNRNGFQTARLQGKLAGKSYQCVSSFQCVFNL